MTPAKNNKNSMKNIILIVLILAVLGGLIWYFLAGQGPAASSTAGVGETMTKYSSSLKNLEKILKFYQSDLLKQSVFNNFKSFVKLPLELGRVGKENPFAAPPAPEELLLKRPINNP